jgi:hypothetical protein
MAKSTTKTGRVALTDPEAPPPTAAPPQSFDPDADYQITLSKSVQAAGTWLHPRHDRIVVKGAVAEQIKDAIKTAEKV